MSGTVKKDDERGTWYFVLDLVSGREGRRRQKRRGFATKKEAETALRQAEVALRSGRIVGGGRTTFGDYLSRRWLPAIDADPKLKPSTKLGYHHAARRLMDNLGTIRLEDLAGDDLTKLYDLLRSRGRAERTVRYVHTTASRSLKDACRWRLIAYNAADEAASPAQTPPQPTAWTPSEVSRFLEVATEDRWSAFWRVAVTTGARRGELCALRWSDLDLNAGTVTISRNVVVVDHRLVEGTPKSGRTRRIGLDAVTVNALKAWRRQQSEERLVIGAGWLDADLLWTWPDGTRLHPNVVSRTFSRLLERAELPPLRLHGLRHSWATNALRAGVRTKVVADRLGHSSTRITEDVYQAFVAELDRDAAEQVASLYGS